MCAPPTPDHDMIESEKRQVKTGNFTFERSSLFAVRKFWKQENLVKTKKQGIGGDKKR
jgi:hypothetical protein